MPSPNIKDLFDEFKKKKYAIPVGLAITFVVTALILVYAYYFCFSYALIAILAFGIPYYFGLKDFKKLAIFGLGLFLVLGLVFGVSGFYEFKGIEGDEVRSADGTLLYGNYTVVDGESALVRYSVVLAGGNGSEEVRIYLEDQWGSGTTINQTMEFAGLIGDDPEFVFERELPDGVYFYQFQLNQTDGWITTDFGFGPILVPDGEFMQTMLISRVFLVFFNVALLFYVLLALVWWTQRSRKRLGEMEKKEPESGEREARAEEREIEKFVCSECGHEVPADATECPQCGEPFEEEEGKEESFLCSSCGAEVKASDERCWNCGKRFSD